MLVETLWKKWTGGLGQIALLKELDKTKTFQRERSYLLIHDTTVHIAAVKNAWKLILKVAHFVAFIYLYYAQICNFLWSFCFANQRDLLRNPLFSFRFENNIPVGKVAVAVRENVWEQCWDRRTQSEYFYRLSMSFVKLPTAEACKLKRVKFFTADMAFRMFQHRSSEVINGYNMKKKILRTEIKRFNSYVQCGHTWY